MSDQDIDRFLQRLFRRVSQFQISAPAIDWVIPTHQRAELLQARRATMRC